MATYPGAALATNIIGYAVQHGRRPSSVWRDYRRHRKDYELTFAYINWEADEQEKAIEVEKAKAKARSRRR